VLPGVDLADAGDSLPKSYVTAGATANDSIRRPRQCTELARVLCFVGAQPICLVVKSLVSL
jgi:hypothetical protein